jgi:hypothetical protein
MYWRDGGLYFMGKSDWVSGSEAVVYRLVPEPGTLVFLCLGILGLRRRAVRRCCAVLALAPAVTGASEFAVEVIAYSPAPGHVNDPNYNDPLGPAADGAGTDAPDNSFGKLGGLASFRCVDYVADDPRNCSADAVIRQRHGSVET